MTAPRLEDRVAHGAQLLDCVKPDWYATVDVDRLDMAGTTTDIHALVFNSANVMSYDIDTQMGQLEVGLLIGVGDTYDQLDDAWKRAINTRRELAGAGGDGVGVDHLPELLGVG